MEKNTEIKKVFGRKLKLARTSYGKKHPEVKSQKEFAEKILDIQQDMLSKYETGRVNIPLTAVLCLKEIGVNLDWFFDVDNPYNEDGIFEDSDNPSNKVNYIDFIDDPTIKKINLCIQGMADPEKDWLAGYIEGRTSKP